MFIDYHTHHARCGHAIGSLEEYVLQGIEIGLDQLGLSDHMPLLHVDPATYYTGMAMPMNELSRYFEECVYLKEQYKEQIDIRIGLEGDYIEGYEEQIERIVTSYPWDYVIGSVHFLGEWDISDSRQLHGWEGRRVADVYEHYYSMVQKAASTGFYHYLGHLDVIKRFGKIPEVDMWDVEKQTVDIIKDNDLAIELNASGLRMPCEEMFPSLRILQYCLERNVPLTVGSDAHQPTRLSQNLDIAVDLLKGIGFQQLATFKAGKRVMVNI